ncbi:MAG: S-layer homology domain-containing protein [Cyanobacteria bacterium J06573_11]
MTQTSVTQTSRTATVAVNLGRKLIQLSLLLSVLIVSGCEGSRLGNNLEKSLEPDPQLAAETNPTETEDDTVTPDDKDPNRVNKPSAANNSSDKPDNAASKPDDAPKEEEKPPAVIAGDYKDIDQAPEEIQPYLVDLIELDLLEVRPAEAAPTPTPTPKPETEEEGAEENTEEDTEEGAETANQTAPAKPASPAAADEFKPNQAMTRREYARWLLATNNRFYAGERTRKIRPGVDSSQPVFQDVPVSDPDFESIQGLAEAGIIPSPLTGSSTTITFRPNAPLTRKDLLLWKVPLDTRQSLPEASVSAVQQAWGFQDAAKIEPRTLQAILADYQNGDFANIRRAFNYTTLFQPDKAATRAEGGAVLWRFGNAAEGITAAEIRNPGSSSAANSTTENQGTDDTDE